MDALNPVISKFDLQPLCLLHNLTRFDKFVARSQFENQLNFFLERKRGQRAPVLLFLLDDAVDVGIFFHNSNLCSLAVHFSVKSWAR